MSAKILININELPNYKSNDKIPFQCEYCQSTFYVKKSKVMQWTYGTATIMYCNRKCHSKSMISSSQFICQECKKTFTRIPSQNTKSKHLFCSRSCSVRYNNTHKTKGTRRSKLEMWIETKLTQKYSNLIIEYNKKNAINSELDIYIPSLKLAFELNGIFHYEPIYGPEKLTNIQNNDNRKYQACLERGIELCIIDTHNVKYLKEDRDIKFIDIISNIIDIHSNAVCI
jgi:hypothetical protein